MTKATLIKVNIELGLEYSFRELVHYHRGRKHGSVQAEMEMEKLRVLHLDLRASGALSSESTRRWEGMEEYCTGQT